MVKVPGLELDTKVCHLICKGLGSLDLLNQAESHRQVHLYIPKIKKKFQNIEKDIKRHRRIAKFEEKNLLVYNCVFSLCPQLSVITF